MNRSNAEKPNQKSRYFFRFTSPTRLTGSSWKTHQKWEQKIIKVNYPKEKIVLMIFDKRIQKNGVYLHYGLGFDIELSAENKKVALMKAEETVLNFLAMISYIDSCYVDLPVLILSYKKPDKDYWLEEYQAIATDKAYHPVETSLRPINLLRLNRFLEKMKLSNLDTRIAIDGAMHWFWRGLGSQDIRDRFINLWISLEFLDEPLKKHFSLPTGSIQKKPYCFGCKKNFSINCRFCGKNYYYIADVGKTGIKHLEDSIPEKIMKFNKLHSFRSQLFHPYLGGSQKTRQKTRKIYDEAIYSIRVLLNYAIFTLLDLDLSNAIPLAKVNMRTKSLPILLEFKGEVKVSRGLTIDDVEKQPSVNGDYEFNFEIKEDSDELIQLVDVKHSFGGVFEKGQIEKVVKSDSSHNTQEVWERKT